MRFIALIVLAGLMGAGPGGETQDKPLEKAEIPDETQKVEAPPNKPAAKDLPAKRPTMGSLSKDQIDATIKQHMSAIRYCYQRDLLHNKQLYGSLSVRFVIQPDGSVSTAKTRAVVLHGRVPDCVAGRFLRMTFPKPKNNGLVIVTYPFMFAPTEGISAKQKRQLELAEKKVPAWPSPMEMLKSNSNDGEGQ